MNNLESSKWKDTLVEDIARVSQEIYEKTLRGHWGIPIVPPVLQQLELFDEPSNRKETRNSRGNG